MIIQRYRYPLLVMSGLDEYQNTFPGAIFILSDFVPTLITQALKIVSTHVGALSGSLCWSPTAFMIDKDHIEWLGIMGFIEWLSTMGFDDEISV